MNKINKKYSIPLIVLIIWVSFLGNTGINGNYLGLKQEGTTIEYKKSYTFSKIGYYTNSSSEYANAAYYLLKYNSFGLFLENFSSLEEITKYSMVIIPFKLNWNEKEIEKVNQYISKGGNCIFSYYLPEKIVNLTIGIAHKYWVTPTKNIIGIGPKNELTLPIDYEHFLFDVYQHIYYPAEKPRNLKYVKQQSETSFTGLMYALTNKEEKEKLGYSSIFMNKGRGTITYIAFPIFDFLSQKAMGGPLLNGTIKGTLYAGERIMKFINILIPKIFKLQGLMLPVHWHTPNGKLSLLSSRDDIDNYYFSAVKLRSQIDKKYGIHSVFYELTDDVPQKDWKNILFKEGNESYHYPGYHRNTPTENNYIAYYNRISDIENETGLEVFFECHHGGGNSGFTGQRYVKQAIEATNKINHYIIYTSREAGHYNDYIEPFLFRTTNKTILPAPYYYSLSKQLTIDKYIKHNKIDELNALIINNLFLMQKPIHYLLHSQNVISQLNKTYVKFMEKTIEKIKPFVFPDIKKHVEQELNQIKNVSATFSLSKEKTILKLNVKNKITGYTFLVPIQDNNHVSNIYLDNKKANNAIIDFIFYDGFFLLINLNMEKGDHILQINFGNNFALPNDLNNNLIPDSYEPVLSLNSTTSDYDGDNIIDGIEFFILGTDFLNNSASTSPTSSTSSTSSSEDKPTSTSSSFNNTRFNLITPIQETPNSNINQDTNIQFEKRMELFSGPKQLMISFGFLIFSIIIIIPKKKIEKIRKIIFKQK